MDINRRKQEMRREIRRRKQEFFANTSEEQRQRLADNILNRLMKTEAFRNAKTVLAYYSLDDELYTHAFLARMMDSKNAEMIAENAERQVQKAKVQTENAELFAKNAEMIAKNSGAGLKQGNEQVGNIGVWPKQVVLPKVAGDNLTLHPYCSVDDLALGAYGIMEPQTKELTDYKVVDLVIVPGMAFDSQGNRLGRGKGYYDRLFANGLRNDVVKYGVCFPFQMVESVPSMDFDVKMDDVFSPHTACGGNIACRWAGR